MLTISIYSFYNVYIFQNNILYLIRYNFCQFIKILKTIKKESGIWGDERKTDSVGKEPVRR